MKKRIGWHIAGMVVALILFVISTVAFAFGVYAFETADFPTIGDYALYAVREDDIIPAGAAVVVNVHRTAERGTPVAYMDDAHICVKYYYGEADGKLILTDAGSENAIEIAPERLRGVAVSTVDHLGTVLHWLCSLAGVCICLGVSLVLLFALGLIGAAFVRRMRENREDPEETTDDMESVEAEMPVQAPQRITAQISMRQYEADENGIIRVLFYGNVTNILKLARLIRALAEKMGADSVTVEECYNDTCGLSVQLAERDLPLIEAIVKMLKNREEHKPMEYMTEISAEEDELVESEITENTENMPAEETE